MRVVVRIGGSVVASPPDPKIMSKYASLLRELKEQGHQLIVVVGGGSVARNFISFARDMGLSEFDQDEVAIRVSRLLYPHQWTKLFKGQKLGKLWLWAE